MPYVIFVSDLFLNLDLVSYGVSVQVPNYRDSFIRFLPKGFGQCFGNHLIELKECVLRPNSCQLKFPELKHLLKIVLIIFFTKLPAKISLPFFERSTPSSQKKLLRISSFEI